MARGDIPNKRLRAAAVEAKREAKQGKAQRGGTERKFKKTSRVKKSAALSELWDEVVPLLEKEGMVQEMDSIFIESMLRHFLLAVKASDHLIDPDREDLSIWDQRQGRYSKDPHEMIHRSQSAMFLAFAREAGITYQSRAKAAGRRAQTVDGGVNPVERIRLQTAQETARLMKTFPDLSAEDAAREVTRRG